MAIGRLPSDAIHERAAVISQECANIRQEAFVLVRTLRPQSTREEFAMATQSSTGGFSAFGVQFASEREAIIDLMDKIRVAEACAGDALASWAKTCTEPALRGGLAMIAEREAYHGRILARRIEELGGQCKASLDPFSVETEACILDPALDDRAKLIRLVERGGDPKTLLGPVSTFAELLTDDLESKEILKLYYADEISSGYWFIETCRALTDGSRAKVPHAA
jgi:hypothetical protein